MPPLEDVHVMEMDRATSRLEVTRINPTRKWIFVDLDATGHWRGSPALIWWQNGAFYDTGGNPLPEEQVPEFIKKELAANPVVVETHGPAVTWVCKYCHEKMNQSEMAVHLQSHMDKVMAEAGSLTDPKGERKVDAKNTHRGV